MTRETSAGEVAGGTAGWADAFTGAGTVGPATLCPGAGSLAVGSCFGTGGGLRSCSIWMISAVGTSTKIEPSEVRKSRVVSPSGARLSWRMVKPLRNVATSVAEADAATRPSRTAIPAFFIRFMDNEIPPTRFEVDRGGCCQAVGESRRYL